MTTDTQTPDGPPDAEETPGDPVTPLTEPADGIPAVTTTAEGLAAAVAAIRAGTGPVAADAERASGYRYGQDTYLVQLRRRGSGTWLVDPRELPDLSALSEAAGDAEWVLHAASQDLPGFAEHGLLPTTIFDTELASRLLGLERVGLGAVVAEILGLGLAKEHSAVDWSTRPLPESWLRYAALDVEVLVDLRDELAARLDAAGKTEWAAQEFEHVRTMPPPAPRVDPWRRTSGMHGLRDRRQLAVVRSLWEARDLNARRRDIAPGRILPDRAIVAAARAMPRSVPALTALREFSGRATKRRAPQWQVAIDEALALPDAELPSTRGPRTDAPPPPRAWPDRNPEAAARLEAARATVNAVAEEVTMPVENVVQPSLLRAVCWTPPERLDADHLDEAFAAGGARPWQRALVAEPLARAFAGLAGA
ncbi:HRDC domain-containing protein [Paraoerskovia marina]|uniref:HRDC domain-containing protein n=1 Tax=Paraoerskovia marina TaxID=545619 RepID=UPI000492C05E|nr:ribonuclease D [Paraoerskovia marina]